MSEPPEKTVGPVKKRRVSFHIAKAILQIHERKKLGRYCDYKSVARAHKMSPGGLRQAYCHFLQGKIDLGVMEDLAPQKRIDKREMHAKTLELVNRHMDVLLVHYEGAIQSAEKNLELKGTQKSRQLVANETLSVRHELVILSGQLSKLLHVREQAEEGYNSFLEEVNRTIEKPIKVKEGHPAPIDVQTHVITANDEQRAIEALSS